MAGPGGSRRDRRTIPWTILAVMAAFVLTAFAPIVAAASAISGATPAHVPPAPSAASPTALIPSSGGSVTNVTLGATYSNHFLPKNSSSVCYWSNDTFPPYFYDYYNYCQQGTQNPSLVNLSNGDLGVAYSMYTTNATLCNGTGGTYFYSWTASNIGWSRSTDNGTTWSQTQLIGSDSCRYPSSSFPSFARGTAGNVYGVFMITNQTGNLTPTTSYVYPPPYKPIAPDWLNLTGDALGFVSSADNGTNWSTVSTIPNITAAARPQLAVYGSTLYIVYTNTSNGTASQLAGAGLGTVLWPPMSVQFIKSTNGGATWTTPTTLPGLNATYLYTASNPSIAVNSAGTIAVAYATNKTCVLSCNLSITYPGPSYVYSVVVSTSSNNGSSWSKPVSVAPTPVGSYYDTEYFYDAGNYGFEAPWMGFPQISVAYTSSGSGIYVVYSGTNQRSQFPQLYFSWEYSAVFASYSGNGGTSWTPSTIEAPVNTSGDYDNLYLGAVGVRGSTAYATWVWANDSYCPFGATCNPFTGDFSQWVSTSTNGATWASTPAGLANMNDLYEADGIWQGWESSVTFTSAGHPVLAAELPGAESYTYSNPNSTTYEGRYNTYVNISIATLYTGNTTYAVFTEHNLSAGANWTLDVNGELITANTTALNVSGIPVGIGVLLAVEPYQASQYRTEWISALSLPGYYVFTGPTHANANFTEYFGVQFWLAPYQTDGLEIEYLSGSTDEYAYVSNGQLITYPTAFPWYFPAHTKIVFTIYAQPPVSYWNGSGIGSVNGTGTGLNLTLGGPVNESAWAGTFGYYTEEFGAIGLPSTSTYSFTFDGTNGSATGASTVNVTDVPTGAYTATGITATSSQSGWEYFGWVAGSGRSNLVVVPAQPRVTLDFALVNLSAPAAAVEFHASGLGTGTVWSMSFNGTTYSSSSPYLNITTRPGTYPWAVGAATVAANASVSYAPTAVPSTVSVTPGTPVTVTFTPAYRVDIISGTGGHVSSVGNHWVAAGTTANYTAVPSNGYEFAGWTGTGPGSYSGMGLNGTATVVANGAISETASFYPLPNARFNLTFAETGVPLGTWWTVDLNGVGYSSNTTQLVVSNLLSCAAGTSGQYAVVVPFAFGNGNATSQTRYLPSATAPSVCTSGTTVRNLNFTAEYDVTVSSTPGGTAYLTDGSVQSDQSLWATSLDSVGLTAIPATGYNFGGWNGTGSGAYTGSSATYALSASSPVSEFATFVTKPVTRHVSYNETFEATPALPAGATWTLSINGSSYSAIGSNLTVFGLNPGPYTATVGIALSADGLTKWAPVQASIAVTISGNNKDSVNFGHPSYWVEVEGTYGGSVTPASSWVVDGTGLVLNATPVLGYAFANWTGSGAGAYSGSLQGPTVTVTGPITETATFVPVIPAAKVASTFWQSSSTWALLAAAGLVVGLIVGIIVRRLRAAPTSSGPTAWTPPPSATEGYGGSP